MGLSVLTMAYALQKCLAARILKNNFISHGRRGAPHESGQTVPWELYNIELMIDAVARKGEVLLCGTCAKAPRISNESVVEGAKRSTMQELAEYALAADKVLVF